MIVIMIIIKISLTSFVKVYLTIGQRQITDDKPLCRPMTAELTEVTWHEYINKILQVVLRIMRTNSPGFHNDDVIKWKHFPPY